MKLIYYNEALLFSAIKQLLKVSHNQSLTVEGSDIYSKEPYTQYIELQFKSAAQNELGYLPLNNYYLADYANIYFLSTSHFSYKFLQEDIYELESNNHRYFAYLKLLLAYKKHMAFIQYVNSHFKISKLTGKIPEQLSPFKERQLITPNSRYSSLSNGQFTINIRREYYDEFIDKFNAINIIYDI